MKTENKIASELSDLINKFFNEEEVAKEMGRDHRTLQQSYMRLFTAFVREQAKKEMNNTDARNESSVVLAKKLLPIIDSEDGYLPFI